MTDRPPESGLREPLRGRARECVQLDGLIAAVQGGEGRSLVLRGEAGIGKTALLEYLIAAASAMTVVRAAASSRRWSWRSPACISCARRCSIGSPKLPAPQRQALEIVFGLSARATPPDRFLVGLATLSLFSEVAEERPLLCVVDDAQWVDRESALTLAFVARRLLAEPVAIVFAAREPGAELRHLSELEVDGLRDGDARALLDSELPSMLDERVRDQIIAETRGNPLALLELPRGLTPTQLAGGFGVPEASRFPDGSRRATSVGSRSSRRRAPAVAPRGGRARRRSAAPAARLPALGIDDAAVDATEGLLELGTRVTFRHPLVRSAVYRSADAARAPGGPSGAGGGDRSKRRSGSSCLAPGRGGGRARRGGRAELEQSAGRAQARGGLAAAAAFLQRAVALTGDPARRADRALAAAQASLGAGAFDLARGLLAAAEAGPLDELQRARAGSAARPRSRTPRAAAVRRQGCCSVPPKTLEPLDLAARAQDLSRRVGLGAVRRALASDAACTRCRARRDRPLPGASAASVRPAAGRLRDRCSPRAAPRRRRCCGARRRRSRATTSRPRSCCAGAGSRPRRR